MKLGLYTQPRVSGFKALCIGAAILLPVLTVLAPSSSAQQSSPQPQDTSTIDPNSPLAPVMKRDQEIRQVDPLAKTDEDVAAQILKERAAAKRGQEDQTPVIGTPPPAPATPPPAPVVPAKVPNVPFEEDSQSSSTPTDTGRDFAGPAVLTRSYELGQPAIPKSLKFTESLSVSTVYDTGVGETGANGVGSGGSLQGTSIGWSFGGGHAFRHDQVGFATGGGMSYYPGSVFYTGSNYNLSAFWSHVISRRLTLSTNFAGAITSANSALTSYSASPVSIANVNLATSPDIGIFDNGSKQGSFSSALNWSITSRLSASFSGSYFGVIRNSPLLYGVSGSSAGGNVSYRLTRRMTIGSNYSYSEYIYPHGTQTSDAQSVGGIFSYAFSGNMQIGFNGGFSHVESLGLQTVPIDPIIAQILGVSEGIIDAYQSFSSGNMSAQFSRRFRKNGSLSLAFARGITPGNGLFQTSMQTTETISYTTMLFRKYSVSLAGGRNEISAAAGQSQGAYTYESAHASISHSIGHGLGMNFSIDYRHFEISSFSQLRNQLIISSGFSWGNRDGRLIPF